MNNQITNNTGIKQDEYQLISVPKGQEKPKKDLTIPVLLGAGFVGMLILSILLATSLSPRTQPVTPTPPLIKEIPTKTPLAITPTRKVSTDSALQTIFDAESSADAAISQSDFTEQKLIPPVLDMGISFER